MEMCLFVREQLAPRPARCALLQNATVPVYGLVGASIGEQPVYWLEPHPFLSTAGKNNVSKNASVAKACDGASQPIKQLERQRSRQSRGLSRQAITEA